MSQTDEFRGWLVSFTGGRLHAVKVGGDFREGRLITYCAIPVQDVDYENIASELPDNARGCIDCHNRLGCSKLHELGQCTSVCGCECWRFAASS